MDQVEFERGKRQQSWRMEQMLYTHPGSPLQVWLDTESLKTVMDVRVKKLRRLLADQQSFVCRHLEQDLGGTRVRCPIIAALLFDAIRPSHLGQSFRIEASSPVTVKY